MVKHLFKENKDYILFMWIKTRVIGGNSSAQRVDLRCKRLVSHVSYRVKQTFPYSTVQFVNIGTHVKLVYVTHVLCN